MVVSLSLDPMPSPSVTMALALKLSTSRLEIVELSASIVPVTVPVIVPDMFPVTCRFSLIVICVESLELNSVPEICIPSTLTLPVPDAFNSRSALDADDVIVLSVMLMPSSMLIVPVTVSYTHLTLPTICSV